jgi:hypothetical protein
MILSIILARVKIRVKIRKKYDDQIRLFLPLLSQILRSPQRCLEAVWHVDLFEDVVEVSLNRMWTYAEFIGNHCILTSRGYHSEDLYFSMSKICIIVI